MQFEEATSCSNTRPASAMSPMREADETAQIAATLALHVLEPQERQVSLVTCSEAPLEEESRPRPCALAESAAAYRERRRQADAVAELELQELIKKTAVRTEEQEASGEKGGDPPALEGPQTIAEVYALCKQLSEAFLLPISEVKACYEDFRSLDIDGNFALSAEEFELAVRKSGGDRASPPPAREWLPDRITWYIDGKAVRSHYGGHPPIPDKSAKIMMNLWIFGPKANFGGKHIHNNRYPMTSEYDWFRFYKWDGEDTYPCAGFSSACLSSDDTYLDGNNPCDGQPMLGTLHGKTACAASCR